MPQPLPSPGSALIPPRGAWGRDVGPGTETRVELSIWNPAWEGYFWGCRSSVWFWCFNSFLPFLSFLDWKWEGEKVLASRGAWGQFSQVRSHCSADPISTPSKFSFQTLSPKRNRCLGCSSKAGGGATRWPDSVVIRERDGRSVAVGDASEPPNLCFLSAQPTFEKSSRITPSAGGAERGREPARGRRATPATTPGKFDAKVGPESVSSR